MARKKIYFYAGILTIVLYVLGVFTGVYISQRSPSQQIFTQLNSEIQALKKNLESIQLQQLYISSEAGMGCSFLISDINKIQEDLGYFYQRLPKKLEVYESSGETDQQYEELKKEYMLVSLRVWLLSSIAKDKCKKDVVPILYFYSKNCTECIEQGNVLDNIRNSTPSIAIFTIDLNLDEQIVKTIKDTYGIKKTPALVVHNTLYGGFMNFETVKSVIGR